MSNQAYEAGVEVALQEILENLGEEFAEKVAARTWYGRKIPGTVAKTKGYFKDKYSKSKKWLSKHPKTALGGAAGLGGGAALGGKEVYDRYK